MTHEFIRENVRILEGDVLAMLKKVPSESVNAIITSPPYWKLRDYGVEGQLGLEADPRDYIRTLVKVFRAARRVLRKDGTLWVNMGDSHIHQTVQKKSFRRDAAKAMPKGVPKGFKVKDKALMPHRLAIALQEDGWYVRQDMVWDKRQPQPETVSDRPTTSHEYFFLLSKSKRYWYDADAIAEACSEKTELRSSAANALRPRETRDDVMAGVTPKVRMTTPAGWKLDGAVRTAVEHSRVRMRVGKSNESFAAGTLGAVEMRNKRSVWPVFTDRMDLKMCTACKHVYSSAEFKKLEEVVNEDVMCACGAIDKWYSHYAAFGAKWIEPAVLAGCPVGGTVLDLFAGTGTTLGVAVAHLRKAIGIDLNPENTHLMPHRVEQVVRMLLKKPAPVKAHVGQVVMDFGKGGGRRSAKARRGEMERRS